MSDATYAELQRAIEAHVASEVNGDLTGSWIVIVERNSLDRIDSDDSEWSVYSKGSAIAVSGLLALAYKADQPRSREV